MKAEQKRKFVNEAFAASVAGSRSILGLMEPRDLRMADVYFELAAECEEHYKTELAEMSTKRFDSTVQEVTSKIDIKEYPELFNRVFDLRMSVVKVFYLYNRWCRKNKLPAKQTVSSSLQVTLMKYTFTVVKSPDHLQLVLDDVCDPIADDTVDLCCRGAAWLSYAGLTRDEVVNVPAEAFDFKNKTVQVVRNGIPVDVELPPQSIKCFIKLSKLKKLRVFKRNGTSGMYQRSSVGGIVRSTEKERTSPTVDGVATLRYIFLRKKDSRSGLLDRLNYENLMRNGFYYRAYVEEQVNPTQSASVYHLDESKLGWSNARRVKRITSNELDKLLELEIYMAPKIADGNSAMRKEIYLRNKIVREYSMWKIAAGVVDVEREAES